MTEGIIALRPHHIDRFVSYYYGFDNMFYGVAINSYGEKFKTELKKLFDNLASGMTGEEYILVRNGPDVICHTGPRGKCPKMNEYCPEPDSLSIWNGSGQIMKDMNLKEGFLYPIGEFMEKVKQLYTDRMRA